MLQKHRLIFFTAFFFLLRDVLSAYTSVAPVWITSPFMRAGNRDVIATLTGASVDPIYTFTFSSALPGIPNLAYGIRSYRGKSLSLFRFRHNS